MCVCAWITSAFGVRVGDGKGRNRKRASRRTKLAATATAQQRRRWNLARVRPSSSPTFSLFPCRSAAHTSRQPCTRSSLPVRAPPSSLALSPVLFDLHLHSSNLWLVAALLHFSLLLLAVAVLPAKLRSYDGSAANSTTSHLLLSRSASTSIEILRDSLTDRTRPSLSL